MNQRFNKNRLDSNVFGNGNASNVIQTMIADEQKKRMQQKVQFDSLLQSEARKQNENIERVRENSNVRSRQASQNKREVQDSNEYLQEKMRTQKKLTEVLDWQIRQKSLETEKSKLIQRENRNRAEIEKEMIHSYLRRNQTNKSRRSIKKSKVSDTNVTIKQNQIQIFNKRKKVIAPLLDKSCVNLTTNDSQTLKSNVNAQAYKDLVNDKYQKLINEQKDLGTRIRQLKTEENEIKYQHRDKNYNERNTGLHKNQPSKSIDKKFGIQSRKNIETTRLYNDFRNNDSVYNDALQPLKPEDLERSNKLTKKQMIVLPYNMKDRMYGRHMAYLNRETVSNSLSPDQMYRQIKNNYDNKARFNILTGEKLNS